MNDTIISPRQQKIIYILKNGEKLSRQEIQTRLGESKISRITLIRDLGFLKKNNFISSQGKARFTVYFIKETNQSLQFVDLDKYFEIDTDDRQIIEGFNKDIFKNLKDLYSEDERKIWEKSKLEFEKRSNLLDKTLFKRELERFIVEFSWKSAQIEGNTYDLLETETLLTQNIEAKGHTREEAIMLINHKNAFDIILKEKESFRNITYSDVLQLHNILTRDLISSGIRNQPVRISGTNYQPLTLAVDLEFNLRKIIKLVNDTEFPPEKALIASCTVAYLQPFKDGNKRTARTLANAILSASGYFPLSYRNLDLNEYRKALILFYEQNNLFNLKRITMEQLKYAMNNYFRIQ